LINKNFFRIIINFIEILGKKQRGEKWNRLFHLTHVAVKHSLYRGSGARGLSAGSIGREKTLQEGIGWVSAY
jgi:hypothetical protein